MRALCWSALIAASCLQSTVHAAERQETLVVCDDVADPATVYPPREFVEKNHTILQQVFDPLVRIDADGRIVPALAESWRWREDGALELRLRDGVFFHDGTPFDARAVKFSIERYLDPNTGFPAIGFLSHITGVEVVDDRTVAIKTAFPDGILLNRLAALVLIMSPKHYADPGDAKAMARPVGTGAFMFDEWVPGKHISLKANPRYWRQGLPRYKALIFKFLPPPEQVKALLTGAVDVVTELPGTETLRVMKSGKAEVIKRLSYYTVAGSINVSSGPLSDVRVRRALNHAINKEELIRYDLLGNGRPLASTTMPGEIGHNPDLKPYPHDIAAAKRLLKEAGYPSGVKLRLIIKYQTERSAKILAKQLSRAGISLDIHQSPDSTLSRDIQAGSWDFTFGGCPDPFSHSFFVQSIFLFSRSPFSIMRLPEYDEMLTRMVSTLDPAEQQRIGMEVDRFVHEHALAPFTYQKIRTYGVKKGVHFTPSITGMPYFDEVASGS